MTTVEEFLRPPHGPEEFGHVLVSIYENVHIKHNSDNHFQNGQNHDADNTSENSQNHDTANSHYSPLAEFIHHWTEFDVDNISLDPLITNCLSMPCEVRWEPQVPTFARVIYSERQLEALYLQTLITRVNIALDKAIPSTEDRIAIVIGPGAFESVSAEARAQRLKPDWIVVQGKFDIGLDADALPILKDLAAKRKILAVGDTKLVRQWGGKSNVPHTRACHRDFLRQVQDYCLNLYTRFGFILSNEELVVAQFERAQETTPRKTDQRGLRSNGAQQLEPGLDSQGSDFPASVDRGDDSPQTPDDDDPYPKPPFATSLSTPAQVSFKRPHSSASPETSPVAAAAASRRDRYANRSFSGNSDPRSSEPRHFSSDPLAPEASSSQDYSRYAPSVREIEVEAMRVRSFDMIGWGRESFDMMDWEGGSRESPYKALFMFVMMVRAFKQGGNSLEI